jgi:hypothetical protein
MSLRGKAIGLLIVGMSVVGTALTLETAASADGNSKSASEKAEKRRRDCLRKCRERNRNRDCANREGGMVTCPCHCP